MGMRILRRLWRNLLCQGISICCNVLGFEVRNGLLYRLVLAFDNMDFEFLGDFFGNGGVEYLVYKIMGISLFINKIR